MTTRISAADLEAYLDEALPVEAMAEIERALRKDAKLVEQLVGINGRRDAGIHSLGEIWRRHRLSCPSREQLGSFLLNVVDAELSEYIRFHVEVSGCRTCRANLDDLRARKSDEPSSVERRRKKYFQSSAGHLRKR
jgi:hypothetical protein